MNDNRPIAVFDSGVGGISVLKELYAKMPNENYIYFGDSKNAPYGSRDKDEVKGLVLKNAAYLDSLGAKAFVVACNTATSVAIEALRKIYSKPVIGMEPAIKPAVLYKENSVIAVMATPITVHEEKLKKLMEHYSDKARIIPIACDLLVGYVEKGIFGGAELEEYIASLLKKAGQIDSIVLGCTHYPFLRPVIEKLAGPSVKIFDGSEGTARETHRRLEECGILKTDNIKGTVTFLNSLESKKEEAFSKMLFSSPIGGDI